MLNIFFFHLGSVILLVGGCDSVTVELYSPEGECQHELAPIPTLESGNHSLFLFEEVQQDLSNRHLN